MIQKAFKFIGASVGVLVAAYTIGWSGAITLHTLFKTERTEAESFVNTKIKETESKFLSIHEADMNGIRGQLNILIDQNKVILAKQHATINLIKEDQP